MEIILRFVHCVAFFSVNLSVLEVTSLALALKRFFVVDATFQKTCLSDTTSPKSVSIDHNTHYYKNDDNHVDLPKKIRKGVD